MSPSLFLTSISPLQTQLKLVFDTNSSRRWYTLPAHSTSIRNNITAIAYRIVGDFKSYDPKMTDPCNPIRISIDFIFNDFRHWRYIVIHLKCLLDQFFWSKSAFCHPSAAYLRSPTVIFHTFISTIANSNTYDSALETSSSGWQSSQFSKNYNVCKTHSDLTKLLLDALVFGGIWTTSGGEYLKVAPRFLISWLAASSNWIFLHIFNIEGIFEG